MGGDYPMSNKIIFFDQVCPVLGVITAIVMCGTSLPQVLRARKENNSSGLNLIIYPTMIANCAGWIAYSIVTRDWYVYFANMPGFILGVFYFGMTYPLVDRDQHISVILLISFLCWEGFLSCITMFLTKSSFESQRLLWGLSNNIILLAYYASPLSSIYKVFKSRSEKTINPYLATGNFINGLFWAFLWFFIQWFWSLYHSGA